MHDFQICIILVPKSQTYENMDPRGFVFFAAIEKESQVVLRNADWYTKVAWPRRELNSCTFAMKMSDSYTCKLDD